MTLKLYCYVRGIFKRIFRGAGEMAQRLRGHTALAEDPSFVANQTGQLTTASALRDLAPSSGLHGQLYA